MKRDMDLVREILIHVSESNSPVDASVFVDTHNDSEKIIYTIDIMKEAGLVKASIQKAFQVGYVSASINSLTWEGHDFLDSVRNDKVWKEVKKTISKVAGVTSITIIKKVAEKILADVLLNS